MRGWSNWPGRALLPWIDADPLFDEIEEFLTGARPRPAADRVLATILFTDIVGSTETARQVGDSAWSRLVQQHHAVVRGELDRFSGEEIDTAGDGFFAVFDGPARAIRCALGIQHALSSLGIQIRAGVHTGEVERVRGDKPRGIAVNVAARVSGIAESGETLVTATVRDLVAGPGSSSSIAASMSSRDSMSRAAYSLRWGPNGHRRPAMRRRRPSNSEQFSPGCQPALPAACLRYSDSGGGPSPARSAFRTTGAAAYNRPTLKPNRLPEIATGVARVSVRSCNGRQHSSGTGFMIGESVVMTAREVIENVRGCRVVHVLLSGKAYRESGSSIGLLGASVTPWPMLQP